MDNAEWQEFVEALVNAKRSLRAAFSILDGIDGCAEGVDSALDAALTAIDTVYAIESAHAYNQDVAAPVAVERFWDEHGTLPGFAIGT